MVDAVVDLRSDTLTHPTEAMREAMRRAEVGDDVYGEDPTVARLEALAADRLGKEAALYVPSGTMANLTAIMAQTHPGDDVLLEDQAHIYRVEGSLVPVAGVIPRLIRGERGVIALDDLRHVLSQRGARPRLLCLENTHNFAGGTVLTPQQTAGLCGVAHEHGLRVHLDGARIFNAVVAQGVAARELARDVDSVMFCVSKGLSAPVGSLLCSSREVIERARRARKFLGGGMRQAGVIAAAGIVALETMVVRLADDHRHARLLAERLADLPGLRVDLAAVQTNIVMVETADAPALVRQLDDRQVRVLALGPTQIRLVTHRHISAADVERAAAAFRDATRVAAGKP